MKSQHAEIEIKTEDGMCPTHVMHPSGAGPWPGVLFFMDGIGMRPALVAMAERLAGAGYYVVMPDLFYRAGSYTAPDPAKLFSDPAAGKEWFGKVFQFASVANVMTDAKAFFAHFDAQTTVRDAHKLGATGYCMGGRLALSAAGHFPERFGAVASYHPGGLANDQPDSPHLLAPKLKARVYVGAAMEDPSFPEDQKQRLEKALTDAHVDHQIETYQARHGWVPSDTPVHDKAGEERHWTTLLGLFERSL
ncbi:MAG TPA: dienelactone hydrolase family protein [Kofleriaceae bacterium]|jgi:carboxymethylenebutenolidase